MWRHKRGKTEVLLVHRPKYNDWSIPKGKLDPGESFVSAATREVEEETGYLVRLTRPLPSVEYTVHGRSKIVRYWAGQVRSRTGPGPKNSGEIDRTEWFTLAEAHKTLTTKADRDLLGRVKEWEADATLDTSPIIIQRHAAAQSRSKWRKGDEETRPLRRKGKKQAAALPSLLAAYGPKKVVTSPWRRCLDTIEPFASDAGIDIVKKSELTEHAHRDRPARAAAVIERVVSEASRTVVCTHRPVLPTVIEVAKAACTKEAARKLPRENPYLAPGEMLVLHTTPKGKIVDVERHLPNIG